MSMPLSDKQEQLSLAVLHATCARAGFGFQAGDRILDNWGVDANVNVRERLSPDSVLLNFRMKFQLKATRQQLTLNAGSYSFPLEIAHYRYLREEAGHDAPSYLVVLHLPVDEQEWCECTPDQLTLRRCLRWVSLRGAENVDQASKTVYVPEAQVLTPVALRGLARARSLQQWIDYDPDGSPYVPPHK